MHQRARGAPGAHKIDQQVQYLRMQDGGRLEMFACGRRAGENKNS